ncbi:hypothetical protein FB451DRAFT_1017305 [Mycena latifolia]|nr:hypothetical protein FB451DRAFT_1017305 [Mycena latifolia]
MSPIHWQLPQFTQHDSRVPSSQPVGATPWDFFDDLEVCSPTHSSQPSKSRRGDLDLQLAPDQPPATKGKPRAYIACIQCRTRKIRCDGAKPICHNCGKRAQTDCNYDPLPKRRGPDKRPGARQRVAREKNAKSSRSPRRMTSSDAQECRPENDGTLLLRPFSFSSPSSSKKMHEASPPRSNSLSLTFPLEKSLSRTFITAHDNSEEHRRSDVTTITIQPSLDFLRKTWYDSLLSLYLSPASGRLESLSSAQRDLASQRITTDLRFLFRASNHWFSFLHAPTFFSNLFDASKRQNIQPSLILAALAMSTFWQSSEIQRGHQGRVRALRFRDEAQSAMEASFNAGWVDDTLAQAAWILAMFEVCPHPHYSTERSSSAMMVLDSIIRALSLTMVDDIDVDPHTSTSSPGKVPAIHQSLRPNLQNDSEQHIDSPSLPISTDPGCSCNTMTLGEQWSPAFEHTPLWTQTPAWSVSGSNAEIRLQSCRRLYWSAVILAAEHSAYSSDNRVDLFIGDPSNNALFSGEAIYSDTETIWGLYGRSLLLWLACIKMGNATAADNDKGQFAIKAWLEADTIEAALNRHTCNIERGFILEGREYIFNTRMCIIYEFQQFVPCCSTYVFRLFQRHKVEEWLSHQANVAQNFMAGLHTITGNSRSNLYQQPFYVFRFMAQLSRGLTLWQYDNSMTVAFDVCKNLLAPIDFLTALWPCAEQRYRYESLRERLRGACDIAGIAPPPPLNLTLPINEFQ